MKRRYIFFILILSLLIIPIYGYSQDIYSKEDIRFINSESDAIQSRFWLIDQAKEEILISYYIFEDDAYGMLFLQKLLEKKAKQEDIVIKIIIDGSANGISHNLMYFIQKNGIKIKEYHPMPKLWLPKSHRSSKNFFNAFRNLNKRMHDKLMIIDQQYVLSGGRNIKACYYGLDEDNFYDRDILIRSHKLGKESAHYYENFWNSKHTQGICPAVNFSVKKDYENDLLHFEFLQHQLLNNTIFSQILSDTTGFLKKAIPLDSTAFMNSYSNDEFDPVKLSTELYELIKIAKEEIIIETPYLLYTDKLYDLLKKLRESNVRIIFITNSFCSNDVSAIAGAYDLRKNKLLEIGIEIYEYYGKGYLHAKTSLIDKKIGLVGSYNIDPRSANINTETVCLFTGDNAVTELNNILQKDMDKSVKLHYEKGKIKWPDKNCEKSVSQLFQYIIFQSLSKFNWIYNLF